MMRANQGPKNRRFEWGHGRPFLQQFSDWLRTARRKDYRSRQRIPHMGLEPLEERQLLAAWPMTHGDIGNTGRADFAVPSDRLNDSFFDIFAWQTRTPGSPHTGNVDSTSLVFYDGVGPQGTDLVVGGYHWEKGVQGMDRHTGQVFWFGNPGGGESIGRNAPAFSNDGAVVYVTNDSTDHPLMAFYSDVGPSSFWHNGADPMARAFGAFSPKVAPDGRIFSHAWVGPPLAATDTRGVSLEQTWTGATVADAGLSDPALYVDNGNLLVVTAGRGGQIKQYDGMNGSQLWSVDTFQFTDATPTIDPATGNVYVPVGYGSISIAGLKKDGTALWTSNTLPVYEWVDGTNHRQRADAGGALSHDGSTYYFQADSQEGDGRLYAINTADGSVKWSFETHATGDPGDSAASSPIITQDGVLIIGNNRGGSYYAIRDDGTQGTQLDTLTVEPFEGASVPYANATATLAPDGLLYLPLRTLQTAAPPGEVPSYQVQNLFTAIDLGAGATARLYAPSHQRAFAGNGSITIQWQPIPDPTGQFDHYAIYRSTAAFSSVSGMTPVGTVSNIAGSEFTDGTVINGTHYYYAVTTVSQGGGEITQINSIGPRTPHDETDLQVVSIARAPEFSRYAAQYTGYMITEQSGFGPYVFTASTGLGGGQTFGDPRFPEIGEDVTYTATVRNRGTNLFADLVSVAWWLDGQLVLPDAAVINLDPGETTSFSYDLAWDDMPHELTFTIDVVDARPENNTLTSDPLAVPFLTYIDKSFVEQFREEWSPAGTNDNLIDWLNSHMAKFNELFATAGVQKRVHYGVLQVLDDGAPAPTVENDPNSPYAVFPFRYRAGIDGNPRLSGYYDPADDIDYGLLHEMGHQLGLIDIYQFDLPPIRNDVSHLGYFDAPTDLMHGVSHVLAPFSALAMEHWLHEAHGYYGQFMYNLPQTIQLRILDYQGDPLPGATVEMYQMVDRPNLGPVITNQIKAMGTTNSNGVFELPNVPIDPALVPPIAIGDTLRANPFGYVAVVGTNGVLHFKVQYQGIVDYAWLDITEPNVAYFQGQTETAVFDRQLALGMPLQTEPPVDMAETSAGAWTAWAERATATATYDTVRKIAGDASVFFATQGGFDNYARYPRDFDARWHLTGQEHLTISFYAENANEPKFQSGSPWIRLIDVAGNYFEYQYYVNGAPSDLLNEALNQWRSYSIPLDASPNAVNGWHRAQFGTPDLTQIHFLEVHADTWGGGFNLWLDGVGFLPVPANEFWVTNTADSGPGSLRQAILAANQAAVAATIEFKIPTDDPNFVDVDNGLSGGDPAPDVFIIQPQTALPAIHNDTVAIIVDGQSESEFLASDSNPFGPEIVLDGNRIGGSVDGLRIESNHNQIRALNIRRFTGFGIHITGSGNLLVGNYIGTDAVGMGPAGNGFGGVIILGSNNAIGGMGEGDRNTIAFNGGNGVTVGLGPSDAATVGNAIRQNAIFSNAKLGIDLGNDGVTLNDKKDRDRGPNQLQNSPVVSSVIASPDGIRIFGTLKGTSRTTFTLEFFPSPASPSQGKVYLGSWSVKTSANGEASFAASFATTVPVGRFLAATATDPSNNTSELSADIQIITDVSWHSTVSREDIKYNKATKRFTQIVTIKNTSPVRIEGPISLVLENLSRKAKLYNKTGKTYEGHPYIDLVLPLGYLDPLASESIVLEFKSPNLKAINYTTRVLAGIGPR